jgi:cyclase
MNMFFSERKATRSVWLLAIAAAFGIGDRLQSAVAQQSQRSGEVLQVLQVRPNFYMIAGAGGNIAVQIGPDGVVLVDAGAAARADAVVEAIKRLTNQPIRYILNSSADADHVGGNEKIAKAGQSLFARGDDGPAGGGVGRLMTNEGAAGIVAAENVLLRMSAPTGQQSPYPASAWPTETFFRKQKSLYVNDEGIQVIHQPAAHTDGDSIVFFRRSDVIVTGDIFDITRFPVIALEKGGTIQGEIDALNRIIDLTIPSIPMPWKEGGTRVIPGHGRISEQAELVEYRDMVTIVRERIQDLIETSKTLDQVKAENPTQGFRRRYGSDSGDWTTDMFVEAVYKSLTKK